MEVFKVNFISHVKSGWLIILCAVTGAIFPYGFSVIKHVEIDSVLWIGPFTFLVFALKITAQYNKVLWPVVLYTRALI